MDDILPVTDRVFNFSAWWQGSGNYFILGGALFLVIAIVFFWAVAIRKPEDRYTSHRERLPHHRSSSSGEKSKSSPPVEHRRKHRKRRSSHPRYPKNPTLAETGGLPPIRQDAPSSPPAWPKD